MNQQTLWRVVSGLGIFVLALLLKYSIGWGWHIGMISAFVGSAIYWKYMEQVADWEKRAALSTLAYIPIQYAVFVGTTGELSRIQLAQLVVVIIFFKWRAVYDNKEHASS